MTANQDRVHATFDGQPIEAEPGASVAAALLNSDRVAWRTTRDGKPRGIFCGIGICFDCLVEIDGQSGQRACMIPLADGMDVRAAKRSGEHAAPETAAAPSEAEAATAEGGCCGGDTNRPGNVCGAAEGSEA